MKTTSLPKHIAFICDGNRRWATSKGLPKLIGHKKGYENIKTIAQACFDRGIAVVSVYVFSTENWNRDAKEVSYLMDLVLKLFTSELEELTKQGVRVVVSGSRDRLDARILAAIDESRTQTSKNRKGTINLCFNYGGQQEIADAFKKLTDDNISAKDITPELIGDYLYQPELPAVDYIIRTSGEQRLSNFLLWDSAYAELEFVPMHWPAFGVKELNQVLSEYNKRQRRFGK